jgi:hypothetical protein
MRAERPRRADTAAGFLSRLQASAENENQRLKDAFRGPTLSHLYQVTALVELEVCVFMCAAWFMCAQDVSAAVIGACATNYRLTGAPLTTLCEHNACVCDRLKRTVVAQWWRVLAVLFANEELLIADGVLHSDDASDVEQLPATVNGVC